MAKLYYVLSMLASNGDKATNPLRQALYWLWRMYVSEIYKHTANNLDNTQAPKNEIQPSLGSQLLVHPCLLGLKMLPVLPLLGCPKG